MGFFVHIYADSVTIVSFQRISSCVGKRRGRRRGLQKCQGLSVCDGHRRFHGRLCMRIVQNSGHGSEAGEGNAPTIFDGSHWTAVYGEGAGLALAACPYILTHEIAIYKICGRCQLSKLKILL